MDVVFQSSLPQNQSRVENHQNLPRTSSTTANMVLLPPTRNAFHPSPSMDSDTIKEIAQQMIFEKLAEKVAPKQTIHPRDIYNAAAQHVYKRNPPVVGVMGGFTWNKWMLWIYIGIPVLIIIVMIGLVMKKQDYTNRRAALEAEAVAAFEGNKEEDIDHSKIYFNQPWSHKEIKEKKAADKAARAAAEALLAGV
ncbi:uncharacterized protein B0J16DRAFT_319273 [Fusarium flagelliforme]|uniref:uncharacterized protein n=1 Tax=Fusarium flagelliforme TaxID=2675880 RepID=UPI001E8D7C70|nr:uncharacterized protein B0J16DRAFT_319273 [Fusarium flagelliforme]KAH7189646.1 hypothetical protein B0J16DRAFT_319273 [Fusarium flagelliforme]